MGEQRVSLVNDSKQMQKFVKALLDDVKALEYMLDEGWFESGITRIGAEQEMVLVNNESYKPASIAVEVLEKLKKYDWIESELARFNLEIGVTPKVFSGDCFKEMHYEINTRLNIIQEELENFGASIVLTGICPTIRKHHMTLDNLTPKKRYLALIEAIKSQMIEEGAELKLDGIDELIIKHDSPFIEAVNTSFQVHLQVAPKDFVHKYNIALAITAPVMAIAANSPLVFGKRLWHESRIAFFQQAMDTRGIRDHLRERSPRVSFGRSWLNESVLDIYKEDIARFRVLLSSDVEEDALEMIRQKKIPKLRALQVHNSTVYRWNRPCYGISDTGLPHLRIENRVFSAGPTVADEVANAAFWLGLMEGMAAEVDDIRKLLTFDDVNDNFLKSAKFGIDSKFNWFGEQKISAVDLVRDELLPLARKGLQMHDVSPDDIDGYLGVIEERAIKHTNGARWLLRAFTDLKSKTGLDEALATVTNVMIKNQISGKTVANWPQPDPSDLVDYKPDHLLVSEFMITDLITVQPDDLVEFVADLMDWKKIRFTPVEDKMGNLVGLVTSRLLLRHFIKEKNKRKTYLVKDIMIANPVTVSQDTTILDAMKIMRDNKIGCLPVLNGKELVGIITEMDFLRISGRLIERLKARK